jgi:NAD(P)-dependent dehydrogenase (short-subunit alcohol dehydrogenase family)
VGSPTQPLNGRTALLTGATTGIGREIARGLVEHGVRLLFVARDQGKARDLVLELALLGPPARALLGDLLRLDDVRRVAAATSEATARLDLLVLNAGGVFPDFGRSADGFERTIALNHLAPFLLTHELLPLLRASAPARIVVMASAAHRSATEVPLDFRGDPSAPFRRLEVYGRSKLANVLFTYALARRIAGSGVTVNCLHPGVVRTGFGRGGGFWFALAFAIASPFFRTARRGADTAVWLAAAPEAAARNGEYFVDREARRSVALSYDVALQERLWQASARATAAA